VKEWTADITNDPNYDYSLIIEILCDDKDLAVIRKSQHYLILKWYATPKGLIMPVDWLSKLLLRAGEGIIEQTIYIEDDSLSKWTANFTNDSEGDCSLLCDGEDVAVIKQSQQDLVLEWYATPKGLIVPVDWLLELLLEAMQRFDGRS